jgi:CubicO group peptidase (beta-lactamase class C family)
MNAIKCLKYLSIAILFLASACGQAVRSVLPTPGPLDQVEQAQAQKLDQFFQGKADAGAFSGAAIVFQDGEILLDKGYGYSNREKQTLNDIDTRFRLDHATLPFTSLATWMLVEQGKLDPLDKVCAYIENCPETWQALTIQHLLDNTSGLPDYSKVSDFSKSQGEPVSLESLVNNIKNLMMDPFVSPTSWDGDSNYILIAAIIEKVTGQSYDECLKVNVLEPLNLKNTGLIQGQGEKDKIALQYFGPGEADLAEPLDMSNLYSAAGMYSTVEDAYLFLRAITNQDILKGVKVEALSEGKDLLAWWTENNYATGSGWFSFEFNGRTVYVNNMISTMKGSILVFIPDLRAGFVILVNQDATPFTWGESIVPILAEE